MKLLTKERRQTPVTLSSVQPVSVKQANKGKNSNKKFRNDNKRGYGGRKGKPSGRNRKFQNKRSNTKQGRR